MKSVDSRTNCSSRAQLDIADEVSVASALNQYEPWALINAAGYVRVDDAEANADFCRRENVTGPARLAKACASRALPLVTFSSDLVFDGEKAEPYVESDTTVAAKRLRKEQGRRGGKGDLKSGLERWLSAPAPSLVHGTATTSFTMS